MEGHEWSMVGPWEAMEGHERSWKVVEGPSEVHGRSMGAPPPSHAAGSRAPPTAARERPPSTARGQREGGRGRKQLEDGEMRPREGEGRGGAKGG